MRRIGNTTAVNEAFWGEIRVDLSGAVLNLWDWTGFSPAFAEFEGAHFAHGANFAHADFTTDVWFTNSTFHKYCHFYNTDFRRRVVFNKIHSDGGINLTDCRFHGMTWFQDLVDVRPISLDGALAKVEFDPNWGTERGWPPGWNTSETTITRSDGTWFQLLPLTAPGSEPT